VLPCALVKYLVNRMAYDDSVITGKKENASKEWNYIIAMVLTSFNMTISCWLLCIFYVYMHSHMGRKMIEILSDNTDLLTVPLPNFFLQHEH